MYPKIVNKMLMKKSAQHPFSKKTPSGGKIIAKTTLQISEQVIGIQVQVNVNVYVKDKT